MSVGQGPTHGENQSFFDAVGGHATFEAIVREFYEGVAADSVLRPMYPEDDLEGAIDRLTLFLEQYWGGPTTYSDTRGHPRLRMRHQPFQRQPRRPRPLDRPHASRGRAAEPRAAARGDAHGLPRARRILDGEHASSESEG